MVLERVRDGRELYASHWGQPSFEPSLTQTSNLDCFVDEQIDTTACSSVQGSLG